MADETSDDATPETPDADTPESAPAPESEASAEPAPATEPEPEPAAAPQPARGPRRLTPQDLALLHKHLLELVKAKAPLPDGLRVVGLDLSGGPLLEVVNRLSKDVEAGSTLSEATESCGDAIPPVYTKLLASGEATGDLEGVLELIVNQAEVDAEIDGHVRDAVVYPAVTLGVIMVAGTGALALIVPGFREIYANMGVTLPWVTQAALAVGEFSRSAFPVIIVVALLAAGLGPRWLKPLGRALVWPLIVPYFHLRGLAGFSRALAGFLARGVPTPAAVEAIREASGDLLSEPVLAGLYARLDAGQPLSEALRPEPMAFPPTYVWVVAMAEQRGSISESLLDLARRYEDQFRRRVMVIAGMLTPLLLLGLGVLVFLVAMAVFMPIFDLQSTLGF